MADSENSSSAFLKWVGGIVASVLTAVLIYHFTRPPQPPPPPIALNGFVADSVSHTLVPNASVTVALGSNTASQSTDELGRYSVVLAGVSSTANMGAVAIQATGYQNYSNTVPLQPGDNFAEIMIDAIPKPAPPPASPPATIPQSPQGPAPAGQGPVAVKPPLVPIMPRAQILLKPPPPDYVKKAVTAYAVAAPK